MASRILQEKELLDYSLFRSFHYDLPDIALSVNQSDAFMIQQDTLISAQCLVSNKKLYYEVTHFAYVDLDDAMELLVHVIDHYKAQGAGFLEIGCGNAHLEQMALFQRAGFRFISIVPNYYVGDTKTVQVENSIPILDMIRFRTNLREKGFTTTGSDKSGRAPL